MTKSKLFLLITASLIAANTSAQFSYKGFGVFGSVTSSKHEYENSDTYKKTDSLIDPSYFYPQSHISKEMISWAAGAFVELGKENLRWQTEVAYTNKGANEMALVNIYTGDRTGSYQKNRLTYIQWNNYLKFYNPIFYDSHWYIMPGVRLEYLFRQSTPVFSDVSGSFPKFWFSGDVALGYEFPLFRTFGAFAEFHWNPDLIRHNHGNTSVRARTFELRIGITKRPRKKRIDDCNAPRYRGPAN